MKRKKTKIQNHVSVASVSTWLVAGEVCMDALGFYIDKGPSFVGG